MKEKRVLLLDLNTGNLQSVQKALEFCGAQVLRSNRPEDVAKAQKIVLPGVGAFGDFMQRLRNMVIEEPLKQALARGAHLLGICVGMQALFESSEEMGYHAGLGILPGRVRRFPNRGNLKVPHTGWNALILQKHNPLLENLPNKPYVYFNHSYYCELEQPDNILSTTEYGILFASAVGNEQILGVQFHPEKSQKVGLTILENFLRWQT